MDPNNESNALYDNCVFKGTGEYKPYGEGELSSTGFIAGTVTCDGGLVRKCSRPRGLTATTCGGPDPSSCGTLGQNCDRYYQQLAVCRIQLFAVYIDFILSFLLKYLQKIAFHLNCSRV